MKHNIFKHTIFDNAIKSFDTVKEMSNVDFRAGSSQQGKHRRASVASNCVTAAYFTIPLELKKIKNKSQKN